MAKKKIQIGMIGLGGVGTLQANTIHNHPDCELAALFDPSETVQARLRTMFPETRLCASLEELLATPRLQGVIIGTPNSSHAESSIAAARAGLHVLCEKPLAMNTAEARRMAKAIKDHGVIGMTHFGYRWVPGFRMLRELVQTGQMGAVQRVHVRFLQGWLRDPNLPLLWRNRKELAGYGVLGDLGSHMADLVWHLTGLKPRRAIGLTYFTIRSRHDGSNGKVGRVTTDTVAQFMVDFGAFAATFETSQVEAGQANCMIVSLGAEKGSCLVSTEDKQSLGLALDETGGHTPVGAGLPSVEIPEKFRQPGGAALDFIRAIQGKLREYPNFEDGLLNQRVLDAVDRSTRSGKWEKI